MSWKTKRWVEEVEHWKGIFMLLTIFFIMVAYTSGAKMTGYITAQDQEMCEPIDCSSCEFKIEQLAACYKGCELSSEEYDEECHDQCYEIYTVEGNCHSMGEIE